MHKPALTVVEYFDTLNRELKRDPDYAEGMEFLPSPSDAPRRGALGYDFARSSGPEAIYLRVQHSVSERYDLKF